MNNRILLFIIIILLWIFFVRYLHYSFTLLYYPFDWDPSEGYVGYHVLQIMEGKPCYYLNSDYPTHYVYPPFFLFITAIAKLFIQDILLCQRLVSSLASLLIGVVLYLWTRKLTPDSHYIPVLAALFFFTPGITSFWLPLGRTDTLSLLLLFAGAYCSTCHSEKPFRTLFGILFLALATFTKQTGIFGVITVFFMLLPDSRSRAVRFLLWSGIIHGVFFAAIYLWAGDAFLDNIIGTYTAQPFQLHLLIYYMKYYLVNMPVLIGISLYGTFHFLGIRKNLPVVIFFIFSLFSSLLVAKRGSSWNLLLPLSLGISLLSGVTIRELLISNRQFTILLLIIQLVILAVYNPTYMKFPQESHWQSGYKILEHVKDHPGPLLCEQFETFANRSRLEIFVEGDLGYELYAGKKWDPGRLIKDIEDHRFSLVIFTGMGGFVKPVKDALRQHYVPIDQLSMGLYSGERVIYILVPD